MATSAPTLAQLHSLVPAVLATLCTSFQLKKPKLNLVALLHRLTCGALKGFRETEGSSDVSAGFCVVQVIRSALEMLAGAAACGTRAAFYFLLLEIVLV